MNQSSIPILTPAIPTIGRRIWSAPAVSNYCPDLSYNGVLFYNYLYDNSWDITSTNQTSVNGPTGMNYNTSTELLIKNGLFTTAASSYVDYSTTLGNAGINYSGVDRSGVDRSGYRFVTFCWRLQSRKDYSGLTFTFNSINNLTPQSSGGKTIFSINTLPTDGAKDKIRLYYAIQDALNPGGNDTEKYNTVWVNGNAATTANGTNVTYNPTNANLRYGAVNSLLSSISPTNSFTTDVIVFLQPQALSTNSTYLYLRVCIPMWVADVQFGSVSATIRT
jgi:hypothetical protein